MLHRIFLFEFHGIFFILRYVFSGGSISIPMSSLVYLRRSIGLCISLLNLAFLGRSSQNALVADDPPDEGLPGARHPPCGGDGLLLLLLVAEGVGDGRADEGGELGDDAGHEVAVARRRRGARLRGHHLQRRVCRFSAMKTLAECQVRLKT